MDSSISLKEFFKPLFSSVDGKPAIIREKKLSRMDYMELFFPPELYRGEITGPKLTWFLTNNTQNKSLRRKLIEMLRKDCAMNISIVQGLCHKQLFTSDGKVAFDRERLLTYLLSINLNQPNDMLRKFNNELRITSCDPAQKADTRLYAFFVAQQQAGVSAAFARMILTVAIAQDAPMELIRKIWATPIYANEAATPEGLFRQGCLYRLDGDLARAFVCFADLARKLVADTGVDAPFKSQLYCKLGEMYCKGEGCAQDEVQGLAYLKMGQSDEYPESYFLLFEHQKGDEAAACAALRKAAALGYLPAVRRIGDDLACDEADRIYDVSLDEAEQYFKAGAAAKYADKADKAYCLYMMGYIREKQGNREEAYRQYLAAYDLGELKAAQRLEELRMLPSARGNEQNTSGEQTELVCFVNALTGHNRRLVDTLPARSVRRVCEEKEGSGRVAQAVMKELEQDGTGEQEILVSLLSENQQDNVEQTIDLLFELDQFAHHHPDLRASLTDRI